MPPQSAREGRSSPFRSLGAKTALDASGGSFAVSFAPGGSPSTHGSSTPAAETITCPEATKVSFTRAASGRRHGEKDVSSMTGTATTPSPYSKPSQTPRGGGGDQANARHGPTRELLEIFEMGVSRNITSLRSEVKGELAASTEALRDELIGAIAHMQGLELLEQIRDKAIDIERGPANVDFRPVLDVVQQGNMSIRDAMQGLDSQMYKSTTRMTAGFQETSELLIERQEQAERERRDWFRERLSEVEQRAEARHEQVLELLRSLCGTATSGFGEVRELQARNLQSLGRLETATDAMSQQLGADFATTLERLQPQLVELTEVQQTANELSKGSAEEIRRIVHQASQIQSSLGPCVETELKKQLQQQCVKVDFQQVMRLIGQAQQTLNEEFPSLFAEIGRIQEELHIEFSQVQATAAMAPVKRDPLPSRNTGKLNSLTADALALSPPVLSPHTEDSFSSLLPGSVMGSLPPSTRALGAGSFSGRAKRVRTFYTQTDASGTEEGWCQTERDIILPLSKKVKTRRRVDRGSLSTSAKRESRMTIKAGSVLPGASSSGRRSVKTIFGDSEGMKARARQALIRPQYNVFDHYHTVGVAQKIAKHGLFETVTLAVIFANAVWLAVDTDLNGAATWIDAEPIFMIGENTFCLYFCGELTVRFLAFKEKRRCLKDTWFVFDSALVALMIIETWIITLVAWIIGGSGSSSVGGLSVFRAARMVKMLRISRMARLLRGVPELFILFKGMKAASRSVGIFFVMWLVIVYVYALIFRSIVEGDGTLESEYFSTVPSAMNNLLLGGILPAHAMFVKGVTSELWVFWPIAISFVSLAFVLLMNMLVGVLVEVVSAIASTEKEGIAVLALATDLRATMTSLGWSTESPILTADLPKLIFEPEVAIILEQAGVDVISLSDMLGVLFEDADTELSFEDLVEVVLNLRDSNTARVKDVKQQLRAIKNFVKDTELELRGAIAEEVGGIQTEVKNFRNFAQRETDDGSDDDDAASVSGLPSPNRQVSKPPSLFGDS